ncbi:actin-like ATPase domain-containing protein [Glonium stellatum]|uniref:Actin-like ATPase domain-containing protein n=1 Tax=Glonium stellatum TaxID=574774 RepID=A0A8E2EXB3_9PEZI|nr:actin-like ATPase domain-containing protein [Glonium stellatum]
MKEHEIVVGIDFGTTYSGVSWAIRSQDDYPNPIRVITNWPHPGRPNATNDKVPSVISYKNGIPSQWGYMAERLDDSCHWFKLRLDKPKNIEEPKHFKIRPRGLKKTAQDMAADYLRMIWEYTKSDISEQLGNIEWGRTHALKVILTVPAVWSATAKSRTLEAARIAGLPANIVLVPEPEAAALAILRDKDRMEETQKLDDVFVICDAGGGTVDLITYKVKRLNPLQVGETAEGDGDFCGSVYLDEEFERHIAEIVQNYEKIQESQRRKMLEDFEYSIKRNFTLNSAQSYVVDLKGAADNLVKGVEGGSILLKPDTICAIFNKIYERIARLVDKQMEQSIFLVGGFGDNYFLFDRLVECYSDSGIIILQADNGWSSVCRGATMWGLENKTGRTVTSRIARVSYGVSEDNFKMHWLQKKVTPTFQGHFSHADEP